jgi:ATP-dependent helicase HrpB
VSFVSFVVVFSSLPIDDVLPDVISALRAGTSVVVKAPAGAGKTTHVPPAILDAGLAPEGLIVVLEPRRLAAQTSARRMAAERSEPIGQTIGYHIRFDRKASRDTRVLVVTEGVFLRMLLDDPLLERIAVVVLDEFHERSLNSDLALALTRRLQTLFRPELKLVVMSATFDPQIIARFLGCPVITSEGRQFPVTINYLRFPSERSMPAEAAAAVVSLANETPGDLLVFLPGVGEIRRTRAELTRSENESHYEVIELYGELPADRQEKALQPSDRKKVILATNVAETSVTIPGVTAVVDTGFARIMKCDPSVGLNRLELTRISRASADQRAGRAGRTQAGSCLRLWSADEWRLFKEYETPEITRLDLAGTVLQLHAWGENNIRDFPWFQSPPQAALDQAEALLTRLGAFTDGALTELGQAMARLPVHPRLARLLIEGRQQGCSELAASAAALLSERDPFVREGTRRRPDFHSQSDVLDRVQALEAFARTSECHTPTGTLQPAPAEHVLRVKDQLLRELREVAVRNPSSSREGAELPFLRALVAAYPDRVARRRDKSGDKGVLVGGRGVRLADSCAVRKGDLFLCVDIEEVGTTEALVRQASRVEREWLPDQLVHSKVEIEFDRDRERVVAFRRARYEDLLLDEAATDVPDSEEAARELAAAAAGQLERALALRDDSVSQFMIRVACLREWIPELQLPQIGDEQLQALLPQLARGRKSFAELRNAPLLAFLQGMLTHEQLAALDREAPERISAASGSRIRLQYEIGRPPVMPVRIQEMFGQLESPRVARGRIRVLLHLLAPNQRAQQITDDLRGFWERTYPIVRKELKRRYPKHSWPDNPAEAEPERRPQRKG